MKINELNQVWGWKSCWFCRGVTQVFIHRGLNPVNKCNAKQTPTKIAYPWPAQTAVLANESDLPNTSPHTSGGNLEGPLTAIVHDDVSQLGRDAWVSACFYWLVHSNNSAITLLFVFFLIFICFSWKYPSRLGIFDGALLLRGPATGPLVMVVFTGALGHMGI